MWKLLSPTRRRVSDEKPQLIIHNAMVCTQAWEPHIWACTVKPCSPVDYSHHNPQGRWIKNQIWPHHKPQVEAHPQLINNQLQIFHDQTANKDFIWVFFATYLLVNHLVTLACVRGQGRIQRGQRWWPWHATGARLYSRSQTNWWSHST